MPAMYEPFLEAAKTALRSLGAVVRYSEKRVRSLRHQYAGTIDVVCDTVERTRSGQRSSTGSPLSSQTT